MTKIYLPMSNTEWLELSRSAEAECRHPRDHARYLLRRALGITEDQQLPTNSNSGGVRQDLSAAVAHS